MKHLTQPRILFLIGVALALAVVAVMVRGLHLSPEQRLEGYLRKRAEMRGGLSGSLAVLSPSLSYMRSFGLSDEAKKIVNTPETAFLLASISKQYMAAAVLRLQEKGKLKITDRVSEHFPEYPSQNLKGSNGAEVTLVHLLRNTSGIPEVYNLPEISTRLHKGPLSFSELLNAVKSHPLRFTPGADFAYSDIDYLLLGEIIRRRSVKSVNEFLTDEFFAPLGLKNSWVGETRPTAAKALSYQFAKGQRVPYYTAHGILDPHTDDHFTDGNVYATAIDLATWVRKLAKGEVLSRESTSEIFKPSGVASYAMGWSIDRNPLGQPRYFHEGSWVGYGSVAAHDPQRDLTLVWLFNQAGGANDSAEIFHGLWEIL